MTTIIDAPVEIVFLYLEDSDRLKRWVPNLVEDESIVETPEKTGSKFRQVFLERGKTMEMNGEITDYVENEFVRVIMAGDMFGLDVGYRLKSLSEAQTEVTQETQIKFEGFMKFVAPIFVMLSKISSKDPQAEAHAKLKEMAEEEYQSNLS